MQKFLLIDYQNIKIITIILFMVFLISLIDELNIKKLYIYHNLFYII